jgi:hypothetical protein
LEVMGIRTVVPKKGLEPPHPCGYMDLNHARLPIPPLRRVTELAEQPSAACQGELLFYSTDAPAPVKLPLLPILARYLQRTL